MVPSLVRPCDLVPMWFSTSQQGERYGGDEVEQLRREDERDALRHHYPQEATKGPHCHPGSQDSSFTATAAQQRENNEEHIQ